MWFRNKRQWVDELVKTEEARVAATNDASVLKNIAIIFAAFSLFTNFVLTAHSIFVIWLLEGGVFIFGIFIYKLISWHQNHFQKEFEFDILTEARKVKKTAIAITLIGLAVIAVSLWLNL
jgi:hypothetical protein